MNRSSSAIAFLAGLALACRPAASAPTPWTDTSPHRVSMVAVAPDVRLEVLDWGGSGPPLVFLSGLQDVAHGFDDFAPKFTDHYHVIAITRRGYGASSQSATGYDLATRVADDKAVLDSLKLGPVILVGHSIAGDELTAFAGAYPGRASKLIYFDAAYDHSAIGAIDRDVPQQPMTSIDSTSPAAVQAYTQRTFGMKIPESQLRAIAMYDSTGRLRADVTPASIDSQMLAGCGHPDYSKVKAPILAIYNIVDSARDLFPRIDEFTPAEKASAERFTGALQGWARQQQAAFKAAEPKAQVLELHHSNHYVFWASEPAVEKAMRGFLGG
ncbi:MAG: alpha/beta fold hydrolase [Gemmatimonadales bacterium]